MKLTDVIAGLQAGTLSRIDLSNQNIGDKGAKEIERATHYHSHVKRNYIKLANAGLGDDGIKAIVRALRNHSENEELELDLSGNHFGIEGMNAIATLNFKDIKVLRLDNNNINDQGVDELVKGFVLYFEGLLDIHGGAPKIIAHAPKTLSLSWNNIGPRGADVLATFLQRYGIISELFLEKNVLGNAGSQAIARALPFNTSLIRLHLGYNNIGDIGISALANSLEHNVALHTLNLNDNEIGNLGAKALTQLLRCNMSISWLNLMSNRIESDGLRMILSASLDNATISNLFLGNNTNSPESQEILTELEARLTVVRKVLAAEPKQPLPASTPISSSMPSSSLDVGSSHYPAIMPIFEIPKDLLNVPHITVSGNGSIIGTPFVPTTPETLVPYFMCAAGLYLSAKGKDSIKKKSISLNTRDPHLSRYSWTALMVLGERLPQMKFGHEAIKVQSHYFDPKKEIGALWFRYANNSLYETVFKYHLTTEMCHIDTFPQTYLATLETHAESIWQKEYQRRRLALQPIIAVRQQENAKRLEAINQLLYLVPQSKKSFSTNTLNPTSKLGEDLLDKASAPPRPALSAPSTETEASPLLTPNSDISSSECMPSAPELSELNGIANSSSTSGLKPLSSMIIDSLTESDNPLVKQLELSLRAHPTQPIDDAIRIIAEAHVFAQKPKLREKSIKIQDFYINSAIDDIKQALGAIYYQINEFQAGVKPFHLMSTTIHFSDNLSPPSITVGSETPSGVASSLFLAQIGSDTQTSPTASSLPTRSPSPILFAQTVTLFSDNTNPSSSITPSITAASVAAAPSAASDSIPDDYICPITQEIIRELVIAEDGHAYEKSAIEAWFEKRSTSPLTNKPMGKTLMPCYPMKSMIEKFLDNHPEHDYRQQTSTSQNISPK